MFDTVDATLATVTGSRWVLLVVALLAAADALVPLAPSESTPMVVIDSTRGAYDGKVAS